MEIDSNLLRNKVKGIYFLFENKKLVYVGISVNIYVRIQQHALDGKTFDDFKYVEIDIEQCINTEINLISSLQPKYNKSVRPYRLNNIKKSYLNNQISKKLLYKCTYCGIEYESEFPRLYHNNACKQKAYRDRRDGVSQEERNKYESRGKSL